MVLATGQAHQIFDALDPLFTIALTSESEKIDLESGKDK